VRVETTAEIGALYGSMMDRRLPERFALLLKSWSGPIWPPVRAVLGRARARTGALAVTAVLIAILAIAGDLSGWLALAGLAGMGAVILMQSGSGEDESRLTSGRQWDPARRPSPDDNGSWRPLVDAIPDAVVALDHNFNVMHFNALFEELFPKAKAGQPLSHVSRNPELNEAVERALVSPEPVIVDLFERVPVERRISATVSRLGGRQGALPLLLITLRDQTEQDRLAQMRADFIANASHELRTPLASLRGFVETLQGPARDDPEARERFLGIMSSQANRMTRLIDDLLSLSRVEMRVHLRPRGIVELNEVAAYVTQALEPLAAGSKTKLVVTRSETPVRIRGDRDEIVQVMQNLVHNAIKYGRDGGHVEIGVSRVLDGTPPQPRVLVAVADDGPGIAPEHLPRLTERFYRANVTASREKGGTGLGLAIVKHIVIRHRGELRISSVVGKGSTFSLLFDELGTRG
jgi:two-component system, OmpR family, phosphate regulon sensor histidine kinase PhoR